MLMCEKILIALKQDESAAYYALIYTRPMVGALLFIGLFDLQRRFLSSMGYPIGPMLCQTFAVLLQCLLNY
jgi:Na+-driven multidrug efflux pump